MNAGMVKRKVRFLLIKNFMQSLETKKKKEKNKIMTVTLAG